MARTSVFKFWEERIPIHKQTSRDSRGDHIEFQVQKHHDQDQFIANSPPLWTKIPKSSTHEAKSPLLPHDHHYSSCLSPTSRSRAILDGKRELMEMIKDLPESSFELSLKDIVEDHAEVKEVILVEQKKTKQKMGTGVIPLNNNKNTSSKLCRSESMESGVFLLKMFLPASLISSRKRSDSRKWPKSCPQPASEGSEKSRASRKWGKVMYLFVRDYKNRRNACRSNSEISSGKNSLVDGTHISCGWSLCIDRKCK